jgi:glycosyltransferase involved in cell wall biosynthesis
MPRLLNLCPTPEALGGVAKIAAYCGGLLTERGWSVRTVFPAGLDESILDRWSKECSTKIETDPVLVPDDRSYSTRGMVQLARMVHQSKPDVTLVHFGTQSIAPRLVLSVRFGSSKCIAYCHAAYPWSGWGELAPRAMRNTERASRLCRAVVACSDPVAEQSLAAGVEPKRLSVIPTGVFVPDGLSDRTVARHALGLPPDAFIVASVLRFVPEKAPHVLLEAAAQLPQDSILVVQGQGPLKPEIEALARSTLPGRAYFYDKSSDVTVLYTACDVFALTSLNEGFPLVLQEAAAHGRPAVATDVGGVTQLVLEGETGFVVPPGDPRAVSEALRKLYDSDDLRTRMGRAARDRAEQTFSAARTVERLDAVLRSVL